MRVGFLVGKLMPYTHVVIKDFKTRKTLWSGEATFANFNDSVKDWDFSGEEHIIYI